MDIDNMIIFSIRVASVMGSFKCVPKQAHWIVFLDKRVFVTPTVVTIRIIKETIKEAILEGIIANNYEEAYKLMIEEGGKLGLSHGK